MKIRSYYKKSAEKTKSGLDLLEKVNPYARGSFWVGIGIFIIAAVTLTFSLIKAIGL